MADEASFGPLLRERRLAACLTQEALAKRAGLSARGIQNLEAGLRHPYPDTLERIVRALSLGGEERDRFLDVGRRSRRGIPAARSADSEPRAHGALPVPSTSLVGREREVFEVRRLLGAHRLVTLTGPGGVGKTRLALSVAAGVSDGFPDAVWFVDLSPIAYPSHVVSAMARALGLPEATHRSTEEQVRGFLADRRMLLVVDNFEHVLDAASSIGRLLSRCHGLHALATSRAPLHLAGEQEYLVPPLTLPDAIDRSSPEQLGGYDAVALFEQRARAVKPVFALTRQNARAVAEICRRLDGLPLAIELAAARTKLFPPRALRDRLEWLPLLVAGPRDAPPRQQALPATIAWSYALLPEAEQALFRRLGVFIGGFTFEAVAAVCQEGGDHALELDPVEGVASLLDKSLLRSEEDEGGDVRLGMLETIREYAIERLIEAGEAERVRRRHAAYILDLVERAEPRLLGHDQIAWHRRLEHEHENIRAALRWAIDRGETAIGLRLAGALFFFWIRAFTTEGHQWVTRVLALPATNDRPARAKALDVAASLTFWGLNRSDEARTLWAESLELARQADDPRAIASGLLGLAFVAEAHADYSQAQSLFEESLANFRAMGDRWHSALSLLWLGHLASHHDDDSEALSLFEQSLALYEAEGDRWGMANLRLYIAWITRWRGDTARARALIERGLELGREIGDGGIEAASLRHLGILDLDAGDFVSARAEMRASLAIYRERGEQAKLASVLAAIAGLAVAEGRYTRGLRLAAAASTTRQTAGWVAAPQDKADLERWLRPARERLDERAQATAWAGGTSLSLDNAIAEALSDE